MEETKTVKMYVNILDCCICSFCKDFFRRIKKAYEKWKKTYGRNWGNFHSMEIKI